MGERNWDGIETYSTLWSNRQSDRIQQPMHSM
jgi:hypothetical protein